MKQPRAVSVIILYDDKKRILLQHRDENIAILPGRWSFFGGAIDSGESPDDAIKRETFEELEYSLVSQKLIMTQEFSTEIHDIIRYVYIEKYNSKQQLILHEGQGMGWHEFSNIAKLKMDKFDIEVLKCVQKNI